jgi:hypothetical protein
MKIRSAVFASIALCCLMGNQSGRSQVAGNRSVNGPSNGPRLQISRAIYGYNGKGDDVTNRIRSQIRNDRVDMEINNDTMGGDPNHGEKKNLKVVYTYGGKQRTKFVNEHDRLRIP